MKKLFLVAALGVAGLMSANNSDCQVQKVDVKFQLCGVIVNFYDANGNFVNQQWYTSDQPNYESCQNYQNGVIADLISQGYRVTQGLTPP